MILQKTLDFLLERNSFEEDMVRVSLYLPTINRTNSQITTMVKSAIRSVENDLVDDMDEVKELIIQTSEKIINSEIQFHHAVGIFLEITPNKEIDSENITVVHFHNNLDNYLYIGRAFDVGPYIRQIQFQPNTIVGILGQNNSLIYSYLDGTIELKESIKNDIRQREVGRNSYSGTLGKGKGAGTIHFGHGDTRDVDSEMLKEYISDLLNRTTRVIKDLHPKYLILFHSHSFNEYIDKIIETVNSSSDNITILSYQKNISEIDAPELSKLLNDIVQKKMASEIEEAENNNILIVDEWQKVVKAILAGKVDTLYLDPDMIRDNRAGFVFDDIDPFPYAVKGSKKVTDLTPWMISKAFQMGGNVKVVSQDFSIGARLRYT